MKWLPKNFTLRRRLQRSGRNTSAGTRILLQLTQIHTSIVDTLRHHLYNGWKDRNVRKSRVIRRQRPHFHVPARVGGGFADSENVNLPPDGTCGELTASPKPSVRRGTHSVGVLGTMLSSPTLSSKPCDLNRGKKLEFLKRRKRKHFFLSPNFSAYQ